ncbi:Replication termination factor 2 [Gnomoniopsis sp. IMI 355080]|nr:Replication termination factor 2 [Gnomoniopsis sp. IMI 355080]
MGNDGGSIPKRRELVKDAARAPTVSELKATAFESLSHAWEHDPLSSEPLDMENIASDCRGRLYNYESILKGLMPGEAGDDGEERANGHDMTFSATGIKSLRDIVRLKFKRYQPAGTKEKDVWACPISLKELGPATKSVYIVPCGHAFAEVAIKEITDQEHNCPECSEPFEEQDIIPILPIEDAEVVKLARRMEDLRARGLTHSKKQDKSMKKKKRKAEEQEAKDVLGNVKNGDADMRRQAKAAKTSKVDASSRIGGINNAMTASLTAKVLAEQEERNKRRKMASASG